MSSTYAVMYVNYFSIKLEGRETSQRSMHPKENEKGTELEGRGGKLQGKQLILTPRGHVEVYLLL